jgi:two-component system, NarL family, nitrate/nitrite response regulator NarL
MDDRIERTKPIRILFIEDHALLRDALSRTLSAEPDLEVVGQCDAVDEALRIVKEREIDLVLLDINLGSEQGGSFLNQSHSAGFRGKVLVVTAGVSDREAVWLLNRGCSGIFLKNEPHQKLVERIREVMSGNSPMDHLSARAVASQVDARDSGVRRALTPRECDVLRGVCEGLSNKEIADRLGLSENTVKSFLQQLFSKTGVRTRAQLVAVAIEQYWDRLEQG